MNDKPALRPDLAVGEPLRSFARDILAEARSAIDDRAKSDAEAVHDFRRAMKRWRALLRLLRPFLGEDGRRLRDEQLVEPDWLSARGGSGVGAFCHLLWRRRVGSGGFEF